MVLYRGTVVDTPPPGEGSALWSSPTTLRVEQDGALLVHDGMIVARGPADALVAEHPEDEVVDCRGGLLLPGFIDTHVHFPQVRALGGLGMPLLDWLERRALPEEARLAEASYAREVAEEFCEGLARAGTTSALVFGSHFASAVDELFTVADRRGLRITSGLVLADRELRDDLLTTPDQAVTDGLALAHRWDGHGRLRYAITPRFAYSCSPHMLDSCAQLWEQVPSAYLTTHVNENPAEIAGVLQAHPGSPDYVGVYGAHGLLGPRTVLAHDVHVTARELDELAATGTAVAHCPTSNGMLGSGLFDFRGHVQAGVPVALGSDVGAGTGFCLLKEGLQAYQVQQLRDPGAGDPLTGADLLRLATAAGADVLGLADICGDFSVGKAYDAVWLRPEIGSTLDVGLRHADSATDALAWAFTVGTCTDIAAVWVGGDRLR
ncbi:Guanine deaminase [Austwickia sp. TVS 96-490-7B]|uniref:guanine deaminase n=1 Tax=Austwickia sp. TVS 96-490-7B TaxID=2830843 RepID=UPI001C5659E2|nr:guanine deaminase [Austwickia sp. TVS 96-490-7B]MBW3084474.1 Guanine deaminase [Austwickia sp. TVS 96-490-7B]